MGFPIPVVDRVCDTLFGELVDGRYGTDGARLPAERELSTRTGASRVSVRSALGRLTEWGVLVVRGGSGATVRPPSAWNAQVLGPFARHLLTRERWSELAPLVAESGFIRRELLLLLVGGRATPLEAGALDGARALVTEVWAARADIQRFAELDRLVIPTALDAAGLRLSVWLLNTLATPYLAMVAALCEGLQIPARYVDAHLTMLDAIERGDPTEARAALAAYFDDLDPAVYAALPDALRQSLTERVTR